MADQKSVSDYPATEHASKIMAGNANIHNSSDLEKEFPVLSPDYKPDWSVEDCVDETPEEDNLLELLERARILHTDIIEKPDSVLMFEGSGDNISVWTRGSISGIIGKAKGGKTGFTIVAVATLLNGVLEGVDVRLTSQAEGNILYFDTEQGKWWGSATLKRIKFLAPDNIERLKYFDLRQYPPKKRLELIKIAIEQETTSPALVVLDGLRDVVFDINSSEEAITILTELMAISVNHNTHITCVLHQNKGDSNARGHLGTELINKAETTFSVNKASDNNSVSIVESEFVRGLNPEPLSIERDENGTPFLSGYNLKRESRKKTFELQDHQIYELLTTVFSHHSEYKYGELVRQLKVAHNDRYTTVGDNHIKGLITIAKNKGWVVQMSSKSPYKLGEFNGLSSDINF